MFKRRRLSHPMTPHGIIGKLGCVFYSVHSFRLVAGYGVANKMSNTTLFNHPSVICRFAFVCRRYHNDYIYYYIIQTHLWTVYWGACFSVPSLEIDLKVKHYIQRKSTIVLLCLRLALASFAVVWFICCGFHSQCGRLWYCTKCYARSAVSHIGQVTIDIGKRAMIMWHCLLYIRYPWKIYPLSHIVCLMAVTRYI